MNTISYLWTAGNNKEFQSFYQKTEEYSNMYGKRIINRNELPPPGIDGIQFLNRN